MGKIKNTRVLASDPETTSAPKFHFSEYNPFETTPTIYRNNPQDIDFLTYNGALYVCLRDGISATGDLSSNANFLKIVDRGPEGIAGTPGRDGVTPDYILDAHFVDKQLVFTVDGKVMAVSPDLTGPAWKPVVEGSTLSWRLTTDKYSPAPIDLNKLRPIQEHPLLLRVDSDNTKHSWEGSGPANYIQ